MIYLVIDYSSPLSQEDFDAYKLQGLQQSSLANIRKSLDESKAILSFAYFIPSSLHSSVIVAGPEQTVVTYIDAHLVDWVPEHQGP